MITNALQAMLHKYGYSSIIEIPNQGICAIQRQLFTTALVIDINEDGDAKGRYCYPTITQALKALQQWDGEADPSGEWIKYKGEGGERRNPLKEEV